MLSYIVRRLLLMVVTLFGVSVAIFLLLRIVPGNIADILFDSAGLIDPAEKQKIIADLGLDQSHPGAIRAMDLRTVPRRPRLFLCVGKAGDRRDPAAHSDHRAARWPRAVLLGRCTGVPLGVISAVRQNTWLDYVLRVISLSGLSMPAFWLGLLILMAFVHWFGTIPIYDRAPADLLELALMLIIPAAAVGFPQFGADHAADAVVDAGGAAAGLCAHRAVQGSVGAARSPSITRCATRCCR